MDSEILGLEAFGSIDRMREALSAQFSDGLSAAALSLWSIHLAAAPGKRTELHGKAAKKNLRLLSYPASTAIDPNAPPCISPLPGDCCFRHESCQEWPYRFWSQAFLLNQQWWHNGTHEVPGITPHNEDVVSFAARQILDMFSPSNIPFANPEVVNKAQETGGANFVAGIEFCVSWRNPTAEDRDLSLDDYRRRGVMAALDAIGDIVPDRKIHAVGYCLGGTLLAITAAAMARIYTLHYLVDTDVTFVLTSGEHNAGIISEPGHPYRTFRIAEKRAADICLSAEEWAAASASHEGSWWIPCAGWLAQSSGAERAAPPKLGAPEKGYPVLEVAPGSYVLQR